MSEPTTQAPTQPARRDWAWFLAGCILVSIWPAFAFSLRASQVNSAESAVFVLFLGLAMPLTSCVLTVAVLRHSVPWLVFVPSLIFYATMWALHGLRLGRLEGSGWQIGVFLLPMVGILLVAGVALWTLVSLIMGPWRLRLWACSALAALIGGSSVPGMLAQREYGRCEARMRSTLTTPSQLDFVVESASGRSGTLPIRSVSLSFLASQCPRAVGSPSGWSGAVETSAGEAHCRVVWNAEEKAAINPRAKLGGFVVFGPKIQGPSSWQVGPDHCIVSGP